MAASMQKKQISNRNFTNDPAFQSVLRLANSAIELAARYQTPPTPKAFEVWYEYARGDSNVLNDQIDKLVEERGICTAYQIDQLHFDHFCDKDRQLAQDKVDSDLRGQVNEILGVLKQHQSAQEDFSGELADNQELLTGKTDVNVVRQVVSQLIEENRQMQLHTEFLSGNLIEAHKNISDIRKDLEQSRRNALEDSLTKLGNRRLFDDMLPVEIEAAAVNETPLCLVITDLDHFKKINDDFGHFIGDQILKFFASLIKHHVKGRDYCARYGGEEFAIILPNTMLKNAGDLMQQLCIQLAESKLVVSKNQTPIGQVTASFGVTQLKREDTAESLIERADGYLYEAKSSGRNRVVAGP